MALVLTRAQVREVDRRAIHDYGISGLVLMENAGRGTADMLCGLLGNPSPSEGEGRERVKREPAVSATIHPSPDLSPEGRGVSQRQPFVVIICGKGNNGGDGFVIARHLDLRGIAVRVLLLADPKDLTGDAATNYQIISKAGLRIVPFAASELADATWLIDAILGTGATGEPKSPLAEAIDCMNASGVPILAVDLPSGLDCDTGTAAKHTIRAAHTCTFVAAKPGFFAPGAQDYVGQLHLLDIGAPRKLLDEIISPPSR